MNRNDVLLWDRIIKKKSNKIHKIKSKALSIASWRKKKEKKKWKMKNEKWNFKKLKKKKKKKKKQETRNKKKEKRKKKKEKRKKKMKWKKRKRDLTTRSFKVFSGFVDPEFWSSKDFI